MGVPKSEGVFYEERLPGNLMKPIKQGANRYNSFVEEGEGEFEWSAEARRNSEHTNDINKRKTPRVTGANAESGEDFVAERGSTGTHMRQMVTFLARQAYRDRIL